MRAAAIATVVCFASWLGLLVGAGNVGLQRSVAIGPLTLLEVPMALALAATFAFVAPLALILTGGAHPLHPLQLLAWVILGDLFGAGVLAPLAVGELEVAHAPIVFAAISALGLQPLAAAGGAWLAGWGVRSAA